MTDTPPVPDEFDSKEELQQYIDQIEDEIDWLQQQLEESEKEKLELKQEVEELNQKSEQVKDTGLDRIENLLEKLLEIERDISKEDTPSEASANALDAATDYDNRN